MSLASEKKLAAPPGKFRAIGVDTMESLDADFLIGDFGSRDEAIKAARPKAGPMHPVYVYDDKGKLVFQAGSV